VSSFEGSVPPPWIRGAGKLEVAKGGGNIQTKTTQGELVATREGRKSETYKKGVDTTFIGYSKKTMGKRESSYSDKRKEGNRDYRGESSASGDATGEKKSCTQCASPLTFSAPVIYI